MNRQMNHYASRMAFGVLRAAVSLSALFVLACVLLWAATPAHAMPEYATRVGEPCGICHVSPAGGGLRNLRGQAWVASDKPAVVPSTTDALQILGLTLPADLSIYTVAPALAPAPTPFQSKLPTVSPLWPRLSEYEGN